MRWQRLKPDELTPSGELFQVGLQVTKQWVRAILSVAGFQAMVDVTHVETLAGRLALLKQAMRAGRTDNLSHECGAVFLHYVARFTVYSCSGLPRCALALWQGPRKCFTVVLSWRDVWAFVVALRRLRRMARCEVRRGAHGRTTVASIRRRENRS